MCFSRRTQQSVFGTSSSCCSYCVFLVSQYADKNLDMSCGFSAAEFSRFDGDVIIPDNYMLIINRNDDAGRPSFNLMLYNNTGVGTTGYHYDLILPTQRHVRQREAVSNAVEPQASSLPATRFSCNKKSLCSITPKSKAVPKPKRMHFFALKIHFLKVAVRLFVVEIVREKKKNRTQTSEMKKKMVNMRMQS